MKHSRRVVYLIRSFAVALALRPALTSAAEPPVENATGPKTHQVRPGEDPQSVLDNAAPGDRIVLLPGLHERPLGRHQSILFADKSIDIELAEGATLKLADRQTVLLADPEITTDHSAKKIDDLEIGGTYDLSRGPLLVTVTIDGEGDENSPDTFRWAYGVFGESEHARIPITGDWQPLAHGIQVRFRETRGHNKNAFWFVSYDGRESYGIRVGHGTQEQFIENVRVHGRGTIDLNRQLNVQPSEMVKDISACILVHGRVRNVLIEDITMTNTMRSVILYGEHTGRFLQGGGVEGGESFDAEHISILSTHTINPEGSAYLLGHPSHRGRLSRVRCNFNTMHSAKTSLEPNFQLDQYEVIGNLIRSDGLAIHCWRRSTNGRLFDNVRMGDTQKRAAVMNNAPSGWRASERLEFAGNINLLSDSLLNSFATNVATIGEGHFAETFRTDPQGTGGVTIDPAAVSKSAAPSRKLRLIVLGRSHDGSQYAAFSAGGIWREQDSDVALNDAWVVPASRSQEKLQLRLSVNSAGHLQIEVQGASQTALDWVARGQFEPAGD